MPQALTFLPLLASSLLSTSAGGKYLSSKTQIRVLGLMAPDICKKLIKIQGKIYSRVKFAGLDDASKLIRRPITEAKRKERRKKNGEKKLNFDFYACPSQNVIKRNASGKKGQLTCCRCLFDYIEACTRLIQSENLQKRSKKCIFGKKPRARARAPGVNKLTKQNTLHAQIMKCKLQGKTKKNERGVWGV